MIISYTVITYNIISLNLQILISKLHKGIFIFIYFLTMEEVKDLYKNIVIDIYIINILNINNKVMKNVYISITLSKNNFIKVLKLILDNIKHILYI